MYTFDSRVRYSEVGLDRTLSLTGIINYLQDCSTFQSEDLGLGIEYLEIHHRAWWLSSWQILIDRYPALGEEIVIGTWPYDFKGMYGYRNFTIRDKHGNFLVRANSIWFFFDTEAGRPIRPEEKDIRGYGSGDEQRLEMEYAPRRIILPNEYKTADPIEVGRHHIDTNRHVNNAQYVEIAKEMIPESFFIAEVRVEYKKAAVLGDMIYPKIAKIPEGYVISLCEGGKPALGSIVREQNGAPYAVVWLREDVNRKKGEL